MDGSVVFARWHQCASHLISLTSFLGSTQVHIPNGFLIGSALARGRQSLYFTMGRPFPIKIAPIWTPSNAWFLGPTRVRNPNGISIGSAVFAKLTIVTDKLTDRPTDRPHYCVCNNRPHLRSNSMRPNYHYYYKKMTKKNKSVSWQSALDKKNKRNPTRSKFMFYQT